MNRYMEAEPAGKAATAALSVVFIFASRVRYGTAVSMALTAALSVVFIFASRVRYGTAVSMALHAAGYPEDENK